MPGQKIIPIKGVDFDSSEYSVDALRAVFLKNVTDHINDNPKGQSDGALTPEIFTPLESNTKYCNIELPAGQNFCCGFGYSKKVKQAYICVYNSNGDHLIYRILCETGTCEKVLQKRYLNFQLDPKHFIGDGRFEVKIVQRYNKITDKEEDVIFIVYTDDFNPVREICVNDVIATKGFSRLDFAYFRVTDNTCFEEDWINLGVTPNTSCIGIEPLPRYKDSDTPEQIDQEKKKPNTINFKGWEIRILREDVWNRVSEWGVISTQYINSVGGTCIQDSSGLARCLKLVINAGCPIINKLRIAFRNCNGNVRGLSTASDWYLYDTIEKYDNCDNKNWWERSINPNITYNAADNTIEYIFCADKECQPIDVNQTNRLENPIPKTSGSVTSLNRSIALARNRRGFEPLDCAELDKMKITVEKPDTANICNNNKLHKITIYGLIWNLYDEFAVPLRTDANQVVFGTDCPNNNPFNYGQVLPKDQLGIIGYLAGTKTYAVSRQYRYDTQTGEELLVDMGYLSVANTDDRRYIPVQKWEMDVLPGKYIFRLASHTASPLDDYQKTSTYLIGQTPINSPGGLIGGQQVREFVIDACDGDVTIKESSLMIYDLTRKGKGCLVVDATSVNAGYLFEDVVGGKPVEMARVEPNVGSAFKTEFTDHNGFYFCVTRQRGLQTTLYSMKNGTVQEVAKSRKSYDNRDSWFRSDKLYVYQSTNKFLAKDRVIIRGKIVLCDNPNVGVQGALVLFTRGGYALTDANGFFNIPVHYSGGGVRTDQVIYSQKGNCQLLRCDEPCKYCFENITLTLPAPDGSERVLSINNLTVKINGYNKKGPTMGGRYGVGIVEHDWLDRMSFVQLNDQHYIDIPSLQETGVFEYSKIKYDLSNVIFSKGTRRVSFFITDNLAWDDAQTWIVDRIQLIDNTGKTNNAAPTQIRIYYESLLEYNKQNGYDTNSVWQFTSDDVVQTGDQVEFVINGDGTIFNKNIRTLIKYDKTGKYFHIDYTDELKDLKENAQIKLIRPKQCEDKQFFYELCPMIEVRDRKAVTPTGYLNFFDSYLLNRQIPVPVTITKITTGENGDPIETSTTENQLRTFPFLFEHHSPSDFWGDHCHTRGRVNVKNDAQNQQCRFTEISVSKALANDGLQHGISYFEEKDSIIFDDQEWIAISLIFAKGGTVLAICEHGNFTVSFNDSQIRVDDEGRVFAPSSANRFGRPMVKSGSQYGLQPNDINAVCRTGDAVFYLDSSESAWVAHDFDSAVDIADGTVSSWIEDNVKAVMKYNQSGQGVKYFHMGFDPKTKEILLTVFKIGSTEYANTREVNTPGENDTLVFCMDQKAFRTYSFTPERFGGMTGDRHDQQLISFKNGVPYMHHNISNNPTSFNNFYGVQCYSVIEVVANLGGARTKNWKYIEVYCRQILFIANSIKTQSGQSSRIMIRFWNRLNKFWSAAFLCDLNTVADSNIAKQTGINKITDGDSLYGDWIRVKLVPRISDRAKYFEFTTVEIFADALEKSGDENAG